MSVKLLPHHACKIGIEGYLVGYNSVHNDRVERTNVELRQSSGQTIELTNRRTDDPYCQGCPIIDGPARISTIGYHGIHEACNLDPAIELRYAEVVGVVCGDQITSASLRDEVKWGRFRENKERVYKYILSGDGYNPLLNDL